MQTVIHKPDEICILESSIALPDLCGDGHREERPDVSPNTLRPWQKPILHRPKSGLQVKNEEENKPFLGGGNRSRLEIDPLREDPAQFRVIDEELPKIPMPFGQCDQVADPSGVRFRSDGNRCKDEAAESAKRPDDLKPVLNHPYEARHPNIVPRRTGPSLCTRLITNAIWDVRFGLDQSSPRHPNHPFIRPA
jgi:hypothetical protein